MNENETTTTETTVETTEVQPQEPNSLGNVTEAVTQQPVGFVTKTTVEKTEESSSEED